MPQLAFSDKGECIKESVGNLGQLTFCSKNIFSHSKDSDVNYGIIAIFV